MLRKPAPWRLAQAVFVLFLFAAASVLAAPANRTGARFSVKQPEAKAVFLAGEFNNWNTSATPMRRDPDGTWSVVVPLLPGKYNYKFYIDGKWLQDFANPDSGPDGHGGKNSVITIVDRAADPVVADKDAVRTKAAQLFARAEYAKLEEMSDELRSNKARFSDGLWKLKEFYAGLEPEREMSAHKDWKPWFDKLAAWRKAFPASITQPVVLARGWCDYAWDARGSGSGHTVTDDDRKLFDERLQKARDVIEDAAELPMLCPHLYTVMQAVALGQGWEREKYLAMVEEAARAEPTYYDYYANAARYLLPRWHGEPGDWEQFAERAATEFDPEEGMTAYTRTAWSISDVYNNLFSATAIEWPKMKQGFLDIEKAYPDSRWNLNAFCRFAVMARDRETANELFARIGDYPDHNWGGYARYDLARAWADPATPKWRTEPIRTVQEREKHPPAVQSVAFSADGKLLASGGESGRVTLWSVATGEQVWSERVADSTVMSVAFSPDGKLLAAGAGDTHRTVRPGIVKLWNVETKEEVASGEPKGTVWGVAFSPDGKTLAVSGGFYNKQAEASLFDIEKRELRALPWTQKHDHGLHDVAISPDGKTLVADCHMSLSVWSVAEERMLFDTRNALKTFTVDVAFSPDGKTLAAGGRAVWEHAHTDPGGLTLWDTATWKERTPRTQDDAGGLLAVAFSPDGKWIAGAGHDRGVHVWEAATLRSKAIYIGHDGIIWAVAFSPDGRTLASGSDDGTIKFWRFEP